ncbi:MAG: hypothetical protein ACYCV7_00290 [Acidimicrobiales bacterium]
MNPSTSAQILGVIRTSRTIGMSALVASALTLCPGLWAALLTLPFVRMLLVRVRIGAMDAHLGSGVPVGVSR